MHSTAKQREYMQKVLVSLVKCLIQRNDILVICGIYMQPSHEPIGGGGGGWGAGRRSVRIERLPVIPQLLRGNTDCLIQMGKARYG